MTPEIPSIMVRKKENWINSFVAHIGDPTASLWIDVEELMIDQNQPRLVFRVFFIPEENQLQIISFFRHNSRIAARDLEYDLTSHELVSDSTGYVASLNWARDKSSELEDPNNRDRAVDPEILLQGQSY